MGFQRELLQIVLAQVGIAVEQLVEPCRLLLGERPIAQASQQVLKFRLPIRGRAHAAPPAASVDSMHSRSVSRMRYRTWESAATLRPSAWARSFTEAPGAYRPSR